MQTAAARGVRRLAGDVLENNHGMLHLAAELRFDCAPSEEPGVLVVSREIAPRTPSNLRPRMRGIEEALAYSA